ncbi:hypothetical protein [Azospirillum isscasi]|nr:hypothetical protein [Azospirillum isscasi]
MAALVRIHMAPGSLADAASAPLSDPDESVGNILANLRSMIAGGEPPPETAARAVEKEAAAVRRVAATMEDGHLAAFVAACHGAAPPCPSGTLALLPCLLPQERRRVVEAFADDGPAIIATIAGMTALPLAGLADLNAALSAFRDGAVFRPAAADLARVAAAMKCPRSLG